MHLEGVQVGLVAALQGDAQLHVALATVLVEIDHEGWGEGFVEGRGLGVGSGRVGCGGRLALVHDEPGGAHRKADCQYQAQHQQQDQLEFAFCGGVFYCFGFRHANNPSSIGGSQEDDVA
ncbi:hypothetical protein D3C76_1392040 [compost metagenome]